MRVPLSNSANFSFLDVNGSNVGYDDESSSINARAVASTERALAPEDLSRKSNFSLLTSASSRATSALLSGEACGEDPLGNVRRLVLVIP